MDAVIDDDLLLDAVDEIMLRPVAGIGNEPIVRCAIFGRLLSEVQTAARHRCDRSGVRIQSAAVSAQLLDELATNGESEIHRRVADRVCTRRRGDAGEPWFRRSGVAPAIAHIVEVP
jgi:hypothetical protein